MSPLTPDERARAWEMLRFPERHDDATSRAPADKLEAEPEPDEIADAAAEHISRWLNGEAWDIIERGAMPPEKREEYAQGLRDHARRGLASMPIPPAVDADTVICCDEAKVASPGCDHVHGLVTLGELIDAYSNPRALERERDEAREALRNAAACLRDARFMAHSTEEHAALTERTDAALRRAAEQLEGVERTHTPVPVETCRRASALYRVTAHQHPAGSADRELATAHAEAFETAGRGEPVGEWPT